MPTVGSASNTSAADNSTILIVSIVAAVAVGGAIIIAVVYACCKRRAKRAALEKQVKETRDAGKTRISELQPLPGALPWAEGEALPKEKKKSFFGKIFAKREKGDASQAKFQTGKDVSGETRRAARDRALRRAIRKKMRAADTPAYWAVPLDSTSSSDDEAVVVVHPSDASKAASTPWVQRKSTAYGSASSFMTPPAHRESKLRDAERRRELRSKERNKLLKRMRTFWQRGRDAGDDEDGSITHRLVRHGAFPSAANPRGAPPQLAPIDREPIDPIEVDRARRAFHSLEVPREVGHALDTVRTHLPSINRQRLRAAGELTSYSIDDRLMGVFTPSNPLSGGDSPLGASPGPRSAAVTGTVQRGMEHLYSQARTVDLFGADALDSPHRSTSGRRSGSPSSKRRGEQHDSDPRRRIGSGQSSGRGAAVVLVGSDLPPALWDRPVGGECEAKDARRGDDAVEPWVARRKQHPLTPYYEDDLL